MYIGTYIYLPRVYKQKNRINTTGRILKFPLFSEESLSYLQILTNFAYAQVATIHELSYIVLVTSKFLFQVVYSGLVCPSFILFTPNEKNGRFFFVLLCIPILLHLRKASQTKTFFHLQKAQRHKCKSLSGFYFFASDQKVFLVYRILQMLCHVWIGEITCFNSGKKITVFRSCIHL